jgi:hypothetical protein
MLNVLEADGKEGKDGLSRCGEGVKCGQANDKFYLYRKSLQATGRKRHTS